MSFDYLIEKIRNAPMERDPFSHLYIHDFFTPEHFAALTAAPEIALSPARSDDELFDQLFANGWKMIQFPGCITDRKIYTDWHKDKSAAHTHNNTSCEGFGVTLRLVTPKAAIITELNAFLASPPFLEAIAAKFAIPMDGVYFDGGVQKYLDGYEISPHPDIRRKALTFMVNINPGTTSETNQHHTQYLRFKPAHAYVQSYWEGRPGEDRCWVPWEWCDSIRTQHENNSIVVFSPNNETIHAVKANYDHLAYQRTQLYGNLWYHANPTLPTPRWEDFVIHATQKSATRSLRDYIPAPVKQLVRNTLLRHRRTDGTIATRNQ